VIQNLSYIQAAVIRLRPVNDIKTMHQAIKYLVIGLSLCLTACSNSPIFINPIYNRLDDQIMKSFERLTDFDATQTAEFNRIANNFHYWHRKNELPVYAALLNDIQKSIRARKSTQRQDVTDWLLRSESFTQSFRACHPVNFSNNIIRSLSDEQLQTIKEKRQTRQAEFREKYFAETKEERIKRRSNNIIKWVSRTGLQLNDKQKKLLRETMAKQTSLRTQYFALYADWNQRLYKILDARQSKELDSRMAAHMNELWHLLENAHPNEWRENRELWSDFVFQLINSFTGEQRTYVSSWLKKMGKTLLNVSRRSATPPEYSPTIGCAVDTVNATN